MCKTTVFTYLMCKKSARDVLLSLKPRCIFVALALLGATQVMAQSRLEATVKDLQTGEVLPFASIYKQGKLSTLANVQGSFALDALPDDTLRITYIGYKPFSVVAGKLPSVVRLQPSARRLPELVVTSIFDQMKSIIKSTEKAVRKHKEEKSIYFFRQSTYIDGTQRNMMEAFFEAHSALTASSVRLITGRIAERGDVIYGADLYRLSQVRLLEKNGYKVFDDETIVPLDRNYRDYYEASLHPMDDNGRTLYEIAFETNDTTRRRHIVTGTLYVDAEHLLPVKMDGKMENLSVFNRSIEGNLDGEELPIDMTFSVNFDIGRRFPEVVSVVVKATYRDHNHDYIFSSVLYNTGVNKLDTKETPEYVYDLRRQIKQRRFNRNFWNRHETIKRTEIEGLLNEQQGQRQ